jgi:hypothetical protein
MQNLRYKEILSRYSMKFNSLAWKSDAKTNPFMFLIPPKASTTACMAGGLDARPRSGKTTARQCFNRSGCSRVHRPGLETTRSSIDYKFKNKEYENERRVHNFTAYTQTLLGGQLVASLRTNLNYLPVLS